MMKLASKPSYKTRLFENYRYISLFEFYDDPYSIGLWKRIRTMLASHYMFFNKEALKRSAYFFIDTINKRLYVIRYINTDFGRFFITYGVDEQISIYLDSDNKIEGDEIPTLILGNQNYTFDAYMQTTNMGIYSWQIHKLIRKYLLTKRMEDFVEVAAIDYNDFLNMFCFSSGYINHLSIRQEFYPCIAAHPQEIKERRMQAILKINVGIRSPKASVKSINYKKT
ncbi:hypothetical protein [Mesotoga prima]|uniref:hypothetical protein n=1 Tax=Mesotoga prima TaxID=1184387 RepID=UPI002FD8A94F